MDRKVKVKTYTRATTGMTSGVAYRLNGLGKKQSSRGGIKRAPLTSGQTIVQEHFQSLKPFSGHHRHS
jgi:hypothetical protein